MEFNRYKAKFNSSSSESDESFWFLRGTALGFFLTTYAWFTYADSFIFILINFLVAVFSYTALSIRQLRPIYWVLWSVAAITSLIGMLVFTFYLRDLETATLTMFTLLQSIIQLSVAAIFFDPEKPIS